RARRPVQPPAAPLPLLLHRRSQSRGVFRRPVPLSSQTVLEGYSRLPAELGAYTARVGVCPRHVSRSRRLLASGQRPPRQAPEEPDRVSQRDLGGTPDVVRSAP